MNSPFSFEGEGGRGDEGRGKDQMSLLYAVMLDSEWSYFYDRGNRSIRSVRSSFLHDMKYSRDSSVDSIYTIFWVYT